MGATTANNAVLGKVLNKATLQGLPIPLPPLDEQRRIVGLLDRAAEIRRRADAARAKARAIIPALFVSTYPQLGALNIMKLHSPQSAVLSAVIFNALVIVALIPLALRGVRFRPSSASAILRRNVLVYGVGGIIVPFVFIKLIDLVLTGTGVF